MGDEDEAVRVIGHELPGAVEMARRRIRRIPGDRVQEQIGVVGSGDVEVNHLLDMPRLRQPERHRELARGQRRRDLPARIRRLELVKRAGIFRGEERDVPLGSELVQSRQIPSAAIVVPFMPETMLRQSSSSDGRAPYA